MILLRHGQSEFNLHFTATRQDPGIEDPALTPLGHAQAAEAASALAGSGITRILASPYTRALQTAAPVARALGLQVRIHTGVRERYAFVCDVGTPRSRLALAWPDHDFASIEERWWPDAREEAPGVLARAAAFRAEMADDAEHATTLVVTHWGFIMALTGRSAANGHWQEFDPGAPPPAEISWKV